MPRVLYFFGFTSPFVALADSRIDHLLDPLSVDVDPIPIVPQWFVPPPGPQRQVHEWKLAYNLEDATRTAEKMGLPWRPPYTSFFADSTDAVVGWYFARDRGQERGYRRAVLNARWGNGLDITDRGVLRRCAIDSGLDSHLFLEALDTASYRELVSSGRAAAEREKIFGVPFFVVQGQRFWGNDRLDALVDFLKVLLPR